MGRGSLLGVSVDCVVPVGRVAGDASPELVARMPRGLCTRRVAMVYLPD